MHWKIIHHFFSLNVLEFKFLKIQKFKSPHLQAFRYYCATLTHMRPNKGTCYWKDSHVLIDTFYCQNGRQEQLCISSDHQKITMNFGFPFPLSDKWWAKSSIIFRIWTTWPTLLTKQCYNKYIRNRDLVI